MKMFKLSLILLLLISVQSCKDDKLVDFAKDVIKHPEKIYDLKKNYPEFYDENCINKVWEDSSRLENVVKMIDEYNKIDLGDKVDLKRADKSDEYLLSYTKSAFTLDHFYILTFRKQEYGIEFFLIKQGDRYYIHLIANGSEAKM